MIDETKPREWSALDAANAEIELLKRSITMASLAHIKKDEEIAELKASLLRKLELAIQIDETAAQNEADFLYRSIKRELALLKENIGLGDS